jgi:hypothetical protein
MERANLAIWNSAAHSTSLTALGRIASDLPKRLVWFLVGHFGSPTADGCRPSRCEQRQGLDGASDHFEP